MLRSGMEWLHSQRHASLSESVTYLRRAAGSSFSADATLGREASDQLIEQQLVVNSDMADFIFRRQDFLEGGMFIKPQPGDRITVDASGGVFEVAELGQDRCWRYSDEFEYAIRVHTRRIAT